MSDNRLFLVCSHCARIDESLCIAERVGDVYEPAKFKGAAEWFKKHAACGRDIDHFQLAHQFTPNHDVPPPAEDTVAGNVRLELAKASGLNS
jgi:hypothetical protein